MSGHTLAPQNCPFPWGICNPSNMWFPGSTLLSILNNISVGVVFCTAHRRKSLYFTIGAPFSKIATSHGGSRPHLIRFLGTIQAHNPNGISIGSAIFCTDNHGVPIFYNGPPLPPQNCPFQWVMWTLSNTWFLGPTRVLKSNGISIGSAVLQGSLVWQTDWQIMLLGQ